MHVELPPVLESSSPVPDRVFGYVAAAAASQVSRFDAAKISATSVESHYARPQTMTQARRAVEQAGLTVVAVSRLGLAVYGPAPGWEELTGGEVVTRERAMRVAREKRYVTHLDIVGKGQPEALGLGAPRSKNTGIEGVVLNRPRFPHAITPSPIPPNVPQFHLRLPQDVALGLNARNAQQAGQNGQQVVVAMVDTGQFNHPFFVSHQYGVRKAKTVFPQARADKDPVGHGTGESANIFAVAPLASLQPYRSTDDHGGFQPETGFLLAKQDGPHIITNSWGGDGPYPPDPNTDVADLPFVHEVQDAIHSGIVVVFSAGNGHFSVEPQIPGVLSAGGVYMDGGMALQASNYASGYDSPWFGGVRVPIVCGLVGLLPRAHYLMLPVQPGCELDRGEAEPAQGDPTTDGTTVDDGWALFSGTSAAAPQLAGAAAVLLSAKPGLKPAQVIEALRETATDVTTGRCHPRFNNSAAPGDDAATGHGLANVSAAVKYASDHF